MGDAYWRNQYRDALDHAEAAAVAARNDRRSVACGFTGNVDRVASLDGPMLAEWLAEYEIGGGEGRIVRAGTVGELLGGIVQCVRDGCGTDLPVADPGVQDWLLARASGRSQIGGTGPQAAVTLDRLGFPTIVHLTGRSPEQIAALGAGPLMRVATEHGLAPAAGAIRPDDPVMWHVALEFAAGTAIPAATGGGAAPAGDRVIVSHDPVNAEFQIDPIFAGTVATAGDLIPAVLISGFSQVVDDDALGRVLAAAAGVLRAWRAGNPGLLVHLELGAMPRPDMLQRVLDALAPFVSSVGLNEDELRVLADPDRRYAAFGWRERYAALMRIGERWPARRIGLHTRDGCLALTSADPDRERQALLAGSLVAAARVATGDFPTFDDCRRTLATAQVRPEPIARGEPTGAWRLVTVPGLRVPRAAAAVGLGDSFTGALLALLAGR